MYTYTIQVNEITPLRFRKLMDHLGIKLKDIGKELNYTPGAINNRIYSNDKRVGLEEIYAVKKICKAKFDTLDAFDDALEKIQLEEIAAKFHLKYNLQSKLQMIRKRLEAEKQIKEMNDYIFILEDIINTSHENKKMAGKYKKKTFELPELLDELNEEELKENENALNDEINQFDGIKDLLSNNSLSDLKNLWLKMPEQKIEEIILASIHQDSEKLKTILNEILNKDITQNELF